MKDLIEQITAAREAYYNSDSPIMSDSEYDALEDELRAIDPDHELLKKVGSEPVSSWLKVNHVIKMGSLDKAQNEEQYNKWLTTLPPSTTLIATEKLDGISIAVEFHYGSVVRAVTRGDGVVGEDITPNFRKMKNTIQGQTYKPFSGWLRGEITLLKSDWHKYMPKAKNPRNAASGTAKRFDGEGCEYLTVKFYDVVSDEHKFQSKYNQLIFISTQLHLDTPIIIYPVHTNEVSTLMGVWGKKRESLDYDIDGIVIQADELDVFESMGETDMRPKGAIAYKFPPKMTQTTVKSITWQIGRSSSHRVTPVAELEPVDLDGITISRASLHTARIAIDSKAGPGAKVIISRRNDVIPMIERVVPGTESEVNLPDFDVKWDGEYLVATKMGDSELVLNALKIWVQRLDILHWGESFLSKLIDCGFVRSLEDIYTLDWDEAGKMAGEGIAARAKESLASHAMEMNFATFISALNIRHCDSTSKLIVSAGYDTIDKFLSLNEDKLVSISGIGPVKAGFIAAGIKQLAPTIKELAKFVTIKQRTGKMTNTSVVFTGAASRPRKELQALAESAGMEVKTSVSAGTTYLVMVDASSTSTKANKARSLGTKIISEEEFLTLVE